MVILEEWLLTLLENDRFLLASRSLRMIVTPRLVTPVTQTQLTEEYGRYKFKLK